MPIGALRTSSESVAQITAQTMHTCPDFASGGSYRLEVSVTGRDLTLKVSERLPDSDGTHAGTGQPADHPST